MSESVVWEQLPANKSGLSLPSTAKRAAASLHCDDCHVGLPSAMFTKGVPQEHKTTLIQVYVGIILCIRPANERRLYIVTSSLIGLALIQKGVRGSFCAWAKSMTRRYNALAGRIHKRIPMCYKLTQVLIFGPTSVWQDVCYVCFS